MTTNQSDKELISRIKAGDKKAFEEFYNKYYLLLFQFVHGILQNEAEGQDITADTFIKVWQQRDQLDEDKNIKAFLFTIGRNACVDHLRATQRHRASHEELFYLSSESEPSNDSKGFALDLIWITVMRDLTFRVEQLPPQCRRVFELVFRGKKIHEVAKLLGIRPSTARSHKNHAIRVLRNAYLNNELLSSD